ncbi:hypothetical protein [Coleofasciculus sp. FACHB-1120]|nr:hypothetical protein [Coleofasciculus sp. FACHB-1120]
MWSPSWINIGYTDHPSVTSKQHPKHLTISPRGLTVSALRSPTVLAKIPA